MGRELWKTHKSGSKQRRKHLYMSLFGKYVWKGSKYRDRVIEVDVGSTKVLILMSSVLIFFLLNKNCPSQLNTSPTTLFHPFIPQCPIFLQCLAHTSSCIE